MGSSATPSTEVVPEAPAAPKAADAPKKQPLPPLPTFQKLVADGAAPAQALADLVNAMALRCKKPKEEAEELAGMVFKALEGKEVMVGKAACEPYYKVQACTPSGRFYRIAREFGPKPTKILQKDLDPAQIKELEDSDPKFLSVILVTAE